MRWALEGEKDFDGPGRGGGYSFQTVVICLALSEVPLESLWSSIEHL